MRNLLLLLLCVITTYSTEAQVDQKTQVNDWVNQHPNFKLLSVREYDRLSDIDKEGLSLMEEHIVFEGGLKMSDIEAYEDATDKLIPRTDVEFVFIWKLQNQSVKIITRNNYLSLSQEKKLMYRDSGAMILLGEELTRTDIFLFEN